MSKQQSWTLNIVGGVCALLILSTLILGQVNNQLSQRAMALQSQFDQVQQVRGTGQNLVSRIAQASANEPALRELLARHQLTNNLPPAARSAEPAVKSNP